MSTVFLHTADWQLGKPFASVQDEAKRHRLQQERLHAVQRLAGLVESTGASFVLVAGDLFDSSQATKATVSAACGAVGKLKVPVLVIPGNHDHGGPGSIWEQAFFLREQRQLAPNLRVLLTPEPVILEDAAIFPAPLLRRHESTDPTAWIRLAAAEADLPAGLPRIILAHGAIQSFGAATNDEDDLPTLPNWIELARLPEAAVDYIALGDWHGTKQVGAKAWYSGTPETDRFPKGELHDPGNVLKVTVTREAAPQVEKIRSGRFDWKQMDFRFTEDASLEAFTAQMDEVIGARGDEHLLRLTLEGSLGMEASAKLEVALESWDSRLLRLKTDHRVTIAPSEDEIAALTQRAGDPLITTVASRLVAQMHGDGEEALIARLALRELHAACNL